MSLIEKHQYNYIYDELIQISLEKGKITDFSVLYKEFTEKPLTFGSPTTFLYKAYYDQAIDSRLIRNFFKSLKFDINVLKSAYDSLSEESRLLNKFILYKKDYISRTQKDIKEKLGLVQNSDIIFKGDFSNFSNFDTTSNAYFDIGTGEIKAKEWINVTINKEITLTTSSEDVELLSFNKLILKFGTVKDFKVKITSPKLFNFLKIKTSDTVKVTYSLNGTEYSTECLFGKGIYLNQDLTELTLTVSLLSYEIKPIVFEVSQLGYKEVSSEKGDLLTTDFLVDGKFSQLKVDTDSKSDLFFNYDTTRRLISKNTWVNIKDFKTNSVMFYSTNLLNTFWGGLKKIHNTVFSGSTNQRLITGLDQVGLSVTRQGVQVGSAFVNCPSKTLNPTKYNVIDTGDSASGLISGIDAIFQRKSLLSSYQELVIPVSFNYGVTGQFLVPGNLYTYKTVIETSKAISIKDSALMVLQGIVPVANRTDPKYNNPLVDVSIKVNGVQVATSNFLSYYFDDLTIETNLNKYDLDLEIGVNTLEITVLYKDINNSVRTERLSTGYTSEPFVQVSVTPGIFSEEFRKLGVTKIYGGDKISVIDMNNLLSSGNNKIEFSIDEVHSDLIIKEQRANIDGRIKSPNSNYLFESEKVLSLTPFLCSGEIEITPEDTVSKFNVYAR